LQKSLASFNKEVEFSKLNLGGSGDVEKEKAPPAYDKKVSFFDTLSNETSAKKAFDPSSRRVHLSRFTFLCNIHLTCLIEWKFFFYIGEGCRRKGIECRYFWSHCSPK
jgi:hypothetical protein